MIKVLAPAKINLYLKVLGRDLNGYHRLDTVFQALELFDEVCICNSRGKARIEVVCTDASGRVLGELSGRKNIVHKAVRLVSEARKIKKGVRVTIKKRIPVAAGMGGGSSDAAAALIGLNREWKLGMDRDEMLVYARKLGADVGFFLYGGTARGTGYGDTVKPLVAMKQAWFVVVNPGIKVSTEWVYGKYDGFKKNVRRVVKGGYFVKELGRYMVNDLEPVVADRYPVIENIKEFLKKSGAVAAMMTGSGPTVFAPARSRAEAVELRDSVAGSYGYPAWALKTFGPLSRI